MKKIILMVIVAVMALSSVPSFASPSLGFPSSVGDGSDTRSGSVTTAVYATTADNKVIGHATASLDYKVKLWDTMHEADYIPGNARPSTMFVAKYDLQIRSALNDAIDSVFGKYSVEYISKNTKAVFTEVLSKAQSNAERINDHAEISLNNLSVINN